MGLRHVVPSNESKLAAHGEQNQRGNQRPRRARAGCVEGDHLFSHRGRFTGFIDFEKMQAGAPCYELARFAWWLTSEGLD